MIARNSAFIQPQVVGDISPFQPTFLELVVGEFSYATSDSVPTLRAEYPLENTIAFTIRRPMPDEVTENDTFGLAVRYTLSTGQIVRYALYKPYLMNGLLYPAYAGQKLGPSAILELWSMPGESAMESATGFTLYAGPLTMIQPNQYMICGPTTPTSQTLTGTAV